METLLWDGDGAGGVGRAMLTGDIHCAVGTEAAVQTPEASFAPVFPVLVLPAATHSVTGPLYKGNLTPGTFLVREGDGV